MNSGNKPRILSGLSSDPSDKEPINEKELKMLRAAGVGGSLWDRIEDGFARDKRKTARREKRKAFFQKLNPFG